MTKNYLHFHIQKNNIWKKKRPKTNHFGGQAKNGIKAKKKTIEYWYIFFGLQKANRRKKKKERNKQIKKHNQS